MVDRAVGHLRDCPPGPLWRGSFSRFLQVKQEVKDFTNQLKKSPVFLHFLHSFALISPTPHLTVLFCFCSHFFSLSCSRMFNLPFMEIVTLT